MYKRNRHALYIFLTISVSLHAIVLITWRATEPVARQSGSTILLSLIQETTRTETAAAPEPMLTEELERGTAPHQPIQQANTQPVAHTSEPQQTVTETSTHKTNNQETVQTPTQKIATTETTTTTNEQGELGPRIQAQLQLAIAPHFSYPMLARKKGWQGQVVLGLHINHAGQLSNIHILRSSGYGVLDDAALSTLKHIASIPEAAQWLNRQGLDTKVPIDYRLADA